MKLRSFFVALGLGCLLYVVPLIVAGLPVTWPLLWLAAPTNTSVAPTSLNEQANEVDEVASAPKQSNSQGSVDNTAILVISKAASAPVIKAGEPLTYTIVVTNTGAAAAQQVIIFDELPAGVHFYGESYIMVNKGVGTQLQVGSQRITGTIESLQPTGRVVIVGRALVDPNAVGTALLNRAVVTATNNGHSANWAAVTTELLTATPTATPAATATSTATPTPLVTATAQPTMPLTPSATPTAIPDLADLQIKKTAAHDPVMGGSLITYTIQVSNAGPGVARNVVLRDRLPKDLFFEGNSALTMLLGHAPKLQLSRTELTATLGSLAVGGMVTITAPVRTPATLINQMLINQATITADTPDPQPANNNAGAPVVLFPTILTNSKNYLPLITR